MDDRVLEKHELEEARKQGYSAAIRDMNRLLEEAYKEGYGKGYSDALNRKEDKYE